MLLLISIVLAIFLLPTPWNVLVLALGLLGEVARSRSDLVFAPASRHDRRRGHGRRHAKVIEPCRPSGRVSYKGERWEPPAPKEPISVSASASRLSTG